MKIDNEAHSEQGREIYGQAATLVLGGFQMIEELIKSYIEVYFKFVKTLLGNELHFNFSRNDYEDAALGKLVNVFSKICSNEKLISDLRTCINSRNQIAHRSLLKTYDNRLSSADFATLLMQIEKDMTKVSDLRERLLDEISKIGSQRGGA